MTPKTQSVCKHTSREEAMACPRYRRLVDVPDLAGDLFHGSEYFEPMAEPASTGEPPPKCPICESTESPHAVGISCNLAARPSEPSAPQLNSLERVNAAFPEFAAPQTSAEPIITTSEGMLVTLERYNELIDAQRQIECLKHPSPALLQVVSKYLEHGLTVSHAESAVILCDLLSKFAEAKYVQPAAPQPVSGDAPDFDAIARDFLRSDEWRAAPLCGAWEERLLAGLLKKLAGDAPKVEEIARQIANSIIGQLLHVANNGKKISLNFLDEVALETEAILRPYFPPASRRKRRNGN